MLTLLCIESARSQSQLIIVKKDGNTASYLLDESKITFLNNDLIYTNSESFLQLALNDVSKITFSLIGTSSSSDFEVESSVLQVYPNPAKDNIYLKGLASDENILRIFRLDGSLVCSKTLNGDELSIDISSLLTGVYIVKTNTQTSKFIKL